MNRPDLSRRTWWWIAVTLPLPVAAAFVYIANEWLFFATKPAVWSNLPWPDRVLALPMTAAQWVDELLIAQLVATALSVFIPRLRVLAVVPAGVISSCLLLMMADNFTHTLFRFSSVRSAPAARFLYAALLLIAAVYVTRALFRALCRRAETQSRGALALVWLLALPPLIVTAIGNRIAFGEPRTVAPAVPVTTGPRFNVLLISADGIEAARMSAYGYARATTTPFLDSIREETLFCENAFANAGSTLASLVSMLTGKLPTTTRVMFAPMMLREEIAREHLPGLLRQRGYRAMQLTVRHYADALEANLEGSFDLANYRWERTLGGAGSGDSGGAARFRDEVADRLETRLLYLSGLGDAPDPFSHLTKRKWTRFWGDDKRVETLRTFLRTTREPWLAQIHLNDSHIGGQVPDEPRGWDKYDRRIRQADERIATIIRELEGTGQIDRTIIVITSDHGRMWTPLLRVPLMIRFPHAAHARREQRNVQLIDVAPTVLDALEMPLPNWLEGVSLLREDRLDPNRPVFSVLEVKTVEEEGWWVAASTGPPNYGVQEAAVVIGSEWLRLRFTDGRTQTGDVDGHTDARRVPGFPAAAKRLLSAKLSASGFAVR